MVEDLPICELLESLEWDGVERIKDMLHHFLGVKSDEYAYEVLKLFLIGCIKRVYEPGCKFDYMLCLVGGQGAGKSSFFRLLAIMNEWFSDDLKKLDDDNVYRKMQGHWIMEMSEMLSIGTAKSTDEIKSFLSRQKETYKDPYDKYMVQEYETRLVENCKLESHRKYIDIQLVVKGTERIDVSNLVGLKVEEEYNEEKDIILWKKPNRMQRILLNEGSYVVFYPENGHMPCIGDMNPMIIKKVVIKIKLQ